MRCSAISLSPIAMHAKAVLGSEGWLSQYDLNFREAVLDIGQVIEADRGENIAFDGEQSGRIFGIIQGSVGCTISHLHMTPVLGTIIRSPRWFGYGTQLIGGVRKIGFHAMERCTLYSLGPEHIVRLRASIPETQARLGQLAQANAAYTSDIVADLLHRTAENRIAAALIRTVDGAPLPAEMAITHADLAEMANTSRSSANAALRRFESEGWIVTAYNKITVLNIAALRSAILGSSK